ncbi:Piwi domain-containing protein [Granulicella rosea]|uniref:Protein argonaute n=1 Tax=Granulicella rosea TaxID=474952 RepID=A0A239J2N7_9BACT|nr:Piwi domain-containing protein [Granulicella rosea]SNS98924.1 Piwi domain-containing protein [Granulicella rosea]
MTSTDKPPSPAKDDYLIHLNFLPVEMSASPCTIYRRLCSSAQEERPSALATAHRLPVLSPTEVEWQSYWVLHEPAEGFAPFDYQASWSTDVSRRILFECLRRSVMASLSPQQYRFPQNNFIQEVSLIMANYPEGNEALVIQPYFLKASRQIGLLVDFHFDLGQDVPFSRRIQQLSLSLDRNFRRNVDYYVDRSSRVRKFLESRWSVLQNMSLPGAAGPLAISKDFVSLTAERLRPKSYVFAGGKESRSQFTGLRDFGPLQALERPPRLLFVFREQDRLPARRLALALKGLKQRGQYNFPGFNELFKTTLEIDANPIVLPDLSSASMEAALQQATEAAKASPNILPVIVLPNGDDNGYLAQKAHFSHAGMPTQVCTLRILEDEESLKWAVANLALQIFCKAGGRPWKVRPTAERSLIIGISQSHKIRFTDDQAHVDKYFAFSVLTDSSGLFQQIQVLGDSPDHNSYVSALRANLKQVLEANAGAFNRVVIHTSFKLKHEEIRAIEQTTREVAAATDKSKCRFSVIKVNHKSRFFGINRSVNSLVPYEATKVRLGPHEYLVWFEGIYPDKPTVTKAFPGPTHLQFLRVNDEATEPAEERELLQDLVNLSGANWRGFNAKSSPVSVFYCHLVADLVHNFHERGLPMPAVQDIQPWFL